MQPPISEHCATPRRERLRAAIGKANEHPALHGSSHRNTPGHAPSCPAVRKGVLGSLQRGSHPTCRANPFRVSLLTHRLPNSPAATPSAPASPLPSLPLHQAWRGMRSRLQNKQNISSRPLPGPARAEQELPNPRSASRCCGRQTGQGHPQLCCTGYSLN